MRPRADAALMPECDDDADHAMPAHAEIADVVEEDDAGRAARIDRRTQQRPDHHIRPARFIDDGGAITIEVGTKALAPLGEGAAAEVRSAGDDDARRLAAGVGVDDLDALNGMGVILWLPSPGLGERTSPGERTPRPCELSAMACPNRLQPGHGVGWIRFRRVAAAGVPDADEEVFARCIFNGRGPSHRVGRLPGTIRLHDQAAVLDNVNLRDLISAPSCPGHHGNVEPKAARLIQRRTHDRAVDANGI